jgi:hypothetical protein
MSIATEDAWPADARLNAGAASFSNEASRGQGDPAPARMAAGVSPDGLIVVGWS